jgi:hypothetical protein
MERGMISLKSGTSLLSAGLGALLCVTPAFGQALSPKDGWTVIYGFMMGAGVQITHGGFEGDGDAIIARDVTMGDATGSMFRLEMPHLRIEPNGEGLSFVPAPTLNATITDAAGATRTFAVAHDATFGAEVSGSTITLIPAIDQMTVTLDSATQQGRPLDEAMSMALNGLSGSFVVSLIDEISLDIDLELEQLDYAVRANIEDALLPSRQNSRTVSDGMSLSLDANGLMLLEDLSTLTAALEQGLSLNIAGRTLRSVSTIEQSGFFDIDMRIGSGESTFEIAMGLDGLRIGGHTDTINVSYGPEDAGIDATAERLDVVMEMPLVPTPEDVRVGIGMALRGVAFSPASMALLGAPDFADDTVDFRLSVGAGGRWLQDLTTIDDSDVPPLDFGSLTLEELELRVGDVAEPAGRIRAFAGRAIVHGADDDGRIGAQRGRRSPAQRNHHRARHGTHDQRHADPVLTKKPRPCGRGFPVSL